VAVKEKRRSVVANILSLLSMVASQGVHFLALALGARSGLDVDSGPLLFRVFWLNSMVRCILVR